MFFWGGRLDVLTFGRLNVWDVWTYLTFVTGDVINEGFVTGDVTLSFAKVVIKKKKCKENGRK